MKAENKDLENIHYIISGLIPLGRKQTSSGWISFNCPACTYNGEPSPDKRQRGNVLFNNSGIVFHCFRCKFKTAWYPGRKMQKKILDLFSWLGASDLEKRQLLMLSMSLVRSGYKQKFVYEKTELDPTSVLNVEIKTLPKYAKTFEDWAGNNPPVEFIRVFNYIYKRNKQLLSWNRDKFYWTPETDHGMNKRVIMPVIYSGQTYGYISRFIYKKGSTAKYFDHYPPGFMFGMDNLFNNNREYVILVEGPFDAIALGGVSINGSTINDKQLSLLHSVEKEIIVVPDLDNAGKHFLDQALDEGWSVSIPSWPVKLIDPFDAASVFGRYFVIEQLINGKIDTKIEAITKWNLTVK